METKTKAKNNTTKQRGENKHYIQKETKNIIGKDDGADLERK